MAFDRDGTLKKAEKLLRQGRLEPAIAEYVRVVEDNPGDWSTSNTLGELYVRAGQPAKAIEQYARIAEHFAEGGFYPKAAALYKKILKLTPQDESVQIQLAEISAQQGLLADAKSYLNAVAARRRTRGDRRGAAEIVVRLGSVDPADFEARVAAARMLEELGEAEEAALRFRALYHDLLEKGRTAEAMAALKEFVQLNPLDGEARSILARAALTNGDFEGAREFLDEHSAGEDPSLLLSLAEIELRAGEIARAQQLLGRVLAIEPGKRGAAVELGWSFLESRPDATFACLEAVVDSALATSDYTEAAAALQTFVSRVPGQIPALLRLVEVCVDGGLEAEMYVAQEQLTDAYLAANQGAEARVIAEDLVAREPWESAHIDRFRKALVMLRVQEPDTLIAERLSGQAPFMAHDPFFDPPAAEGSNPSPADEESSPDTEADGDAGVQPADVPAETTTSSSASASSGEHREAEQPVAPAARGGDEIDLTGALGNLHGNEPIEKRGKSLDQVFSQIRDEAGADADFSSQHMTLARTYLEIGMLDEALASLQTAVRSSQHRFEASAAIGRLHQRRGDAAAAIEWLERAAEVAPSTDAEGQTLLYDLGVLLEEAGETSRALAVFLELQANAGDYRDVPSRIDRLARVQTGG